MQETETERRRTCIYVEDGYCVDIVISSITFSASAQPSYGEPDTTIGCLSVRFSVRYSLITRLAFVTQKIVFLPVGTYILGNPLDPER